MALDLDIRKQLNNYELHMSLSLPDGVTAILGASGSGKSVTLSCIAGLMQPDAGEIRIDDQVVFDSTQRIHVPARKRQVGMLFQGYSLFPNMTVTENIAAGVRGSRRQVGEVVAAYMERFQITALANQRPATLSGGQKQRVALARMLAAEPKTLLLDEPFSALDATLKWQMEEELRETLQAVQGTTLLVTHDRDEAYRIADYVAVVDQGRVDHFGPKELLMRAPKTLASAQLSGCKNTTEAFHTDARIISCPHWALQLDAGDVQEHPVRYIGLRAHYFRPATDLDRVNTFDAILERVSESPFSWLIYLRPILDNQSAEEVLYWILDKSNHAPWLFGQSQETWLAAHCGCKLRMTIDADGILFLQ